MYYWYQNFSTKLIVKSIWRLFKPIKFKSLATFAEIEDETVWQILKLMEATTNQKIYTELFYQAIEERHHADLFFSYLKKHGISRDIHSLGPRLPLTTGSDNVWQVLTYFNLGELEAYKKFESISQAVHSPEEKALFQSIVLDEKNHVGLADSLLKLLHIDELTLRSEKKRLFWQLRTDALKKVGNQIFGTINTLFLSVLYFLYGPFATYYARKRIFSSHNSRKTLKFNELF